jgi:hypothetical protein
LKSSGRERGYDAIPEVFGKKDAIGACPLSLTRRFLWFIA